MCRRLLLVTLLLLMSACLEPFHPDVPEEQIQLLVVDGYINIGPGKTTIKLSQVRTLQQGVSYDGLRDATVEVIDVEGTRYSLPATINGEYSADLNLSDDHTYKLSVTLKNGKHYESALLTPKITPAIDSLWWTIDERVNIHVASHDDNNLSKFYLWTFREDWQFEAPIGAVYSWGNDTLQMLTAEERNAMKTCYKSFVSKGYRLATSAALSSDRITEVLTSIPIGSQRTSVKYSLTVTQRTLTEDEFNYQQLMNKNTDAVGSFFDPLPSELYGNVFCTTNPGELAIGYVGAYSTATARIFILENDLPPAPVQEHCLSTAVLWADKVLLNETLANYAPTGMIESQGNFYVLLTERSCMDCRLYGSGPRPDFWD